MNSLRHFALNWLLLAVYGEKRNSPNSQCANISRTRWDIRIILKLAYRGWKIIGELFEAICSKLTFACCLGRKTKFATIVYIVRKCPVKENSASNVVVGLERTTLRILSFKNLNANFYPLYDFYDFLNQSIVNLKYSLQLSW